VSDHTGGKDPVSIKKLERGDAQWSATKEILGYVLDGKARTIRLPSDKATRIITELHRVLRKTRIPIKRFQSLVGKLRHAANILPAARSLFTPLNNALKGDPSWISLGKATEVRSAFQDFLIIIRELERRPTHVSELVFGPNAYIGFVDACKKGAGGVWFGGENSLQPIVWRIPFPDDVTAEVVSEANPNGRLTNSDLEMAGVVLQQAVLQCTVPLQRSRSVINCDNTPSVAWVHRMATRTQYDVSHRLLRGMALQQRTNESVPPELVSVAGVDNELADIPSRITEYWKPRPNDNNPGRAPTNAEFLTFFNDSFPLPQSKCWKVVTPDPVTLSNVISTLRGKRLALQQ
jgi:hypothetical protein